MIDWINEDIAISEMAMIHRKLFTTLLLGVLLVVLAPILVSAASTTSAPTPYRLTYQFDWAWGKAQPDATGTGWQVSNNLGYQIHVQQGYLVLASAELIACAHDHSHAATATSLVQQLFGAPVAYAGHTSTHHDASWLTAAQVEALSNPAGLTVPSALGNEPAYCQIHYLVADVTQSAPRLFGRVNMLGKSLYITGDYQAPGSNQRIPFVIQSKLAWGALLDLTLSANATVQTLDSTIRRTSGPRVVIRRNLGTMFDQIDFAKMSATTQGRTVLRNPTKSATAQLIE